MKTAADILLIVLLYGLFGYLHSFLALNKIKRSFAEKGGNKIAFYRIFYNIISIITIIAFFELTPKPDQIIFELRYPYDFIVFGFQALSLIGVVISFSQMDMGELSGIAQVKRYYEGTYDSEQLDANQKLELKGLRRISRHPLYFFFILFLLFRPYMDLFYFVLLICSIVYLYIGAYFEEKKLIEKFGDDYINYKKRVSKIIPFKIFIKAG